MVSILLLSLRVAGLFAMSPLLRMAGLPASAKVVLILSLSLLIGAGLQPSPAGLTTLLDSLDTKATNPLASLQIDGKFLVAATHELLFGAMLGLGVTLAFAALHMGGSVLDMQIGYSLATLYDPATQRNSALMAGFTERLGVLVFLLLNGHHALLRGLALSAEFFPPGGNWHLTAGFAPITQQAGSMMALGFSLAAPVVFCMLLLELTLGVIARSLPQVNIFAISLPIKMLAGLGVLAAWALMMGAGLAKVLTSITKVWQGCFAAMQTGAM